MKIRRLPADWEYHASSLKEPCTMPMAFQAEFPDVHPPGTLKTLGGTAGHSVMELWLLGKGMTLQDGTFVHDIEAGDMEQIWFSALCEAADADTAKSGKEWSDDMLEDYAAETSSDYAAQIRGFMQWWKRGGFELIFVEANYRLEIAGSKESTAPYIVVGRIDLCLRDVHGVLAFPGAVGIADWKFGRMEKGKIADQVALDLHYQLSTYTVGVRDGRVDAIGPDGNALALTGFSPDFEGLILMDDFLPYAKKTSISNPSYCTDSKRDWLTQRRQDAMARVNDTTRELQELLDQRRDDAAAYPNNKAKQQSLEVAVRKLKEHTEAPVLYHEVGWERGPGFHGTAFTEVAMDSHRAEMRAKMASTRMGGGLYRTVTEKCVFCFWKNVCLKDRLGQPIDTSDPGLWDAPPEDDKEFGNGQ